MTLDLVPHDEVIKEDRRNTRKRFLETDAICALCGCVNNAYWEDNCVVCSCKCGNRSFITGKIAIDLRLLMDFHIEELKSLCEIHGISFGSRASMTVRLLKEFHDGYKNRNKFDERINEVLIKKILTRNKRKFRFTIDIMNAVDVIKRNIKFELVKEEDILKE